jgi:Zn-dependent protease with chaperone function
VIPLLVRFLIYNLLPGLVSGLLLWLLVNAAVALLRVRNGALRLPLLYVPLVKSILVTLGVGLVFPWPRSLFAAWHARAIPVGSILPFYLIWVGLTLLFGYLLVRRARRQVVEGAIPAQQVDTRLDSALNQVMANYQNQPVYQVGEGWICCRTGVHLSRPELWVTDKVGVPLVVKDQEDPILVFPSGLSENLDQAELEMVLAHEVAHLTLQRPICCASFAINQFTFTDPLAALLASRLRYEEEKACDDLVVTFLGQPELYAEALLKSYRFANKQSKGANWMRLDTSFHLLDAKRGLPERVERLLDNQEPAGGLWHQRCATCLIWVFVAVLFG